MGLLALLLEICSLVVLLSADPDLLFANRKDVRVVTVVYNRTSPTSNIVVSSLGEAAAVDFIWSEGAVFWTDVRDEKIQRRDVATGVISDVVSTGVITPDGLACDWVGLKLYWTDAETNRIEVSELNGMSRKVLVWKEMDQPRAVTLDPLQGFLFWTDWGEEPKIESAGMDGSGRTVIIHEQIEWPNGLTIDYDTSRLYWTDARLQYINSCHYDGSDRISLAEESITTHPFALTVLGDTIYWTDWDTNSIHACDKVTGGILQPVLADLTPMDIHVYSPSRQPIREENPCVDNGGCSHLCLLSPRPPFYACACPTGVLLQRDNRTCASGAENLLLLARRVDVRRISLDTPDYTAIKLNVTGIKHAFAIDYDPVEDFVYWTDDMSKAIRRAKLDGSESQYLVRSNLDKPDGIAIDPVARNMYWMDSGLETIEVARLNGSSRKVIIKDNIKKPRAIALHPQKGLMYWTDWGSEAKIERASLDGSDRVVLLNTSIAWPNGLSIDYEASLIYWGDGKLDKIEVMDLDGNDRRILKEEFTPHVFGFSLLGDYVYWTDWQSRTIERCHKGTGEDHEVLIEELADLMGLKAVNVNMVVGTNPCSDNNGRCTHLCLHRPAGHICACPTGMELLPDLRTCIFPEAFLLLCFRDDVQRVSLETEFNNVDIPLAGVEGASSLDFDFSVGMIYWSDQELKKISKAYMNGTGREDVIEFGIASPTSIAVDWIAHNIYFIDLIKQRIEVSRLDGYSRRVLIWQNISQPNALCLDPAAGYMYFADWDPNTIVRAHLDGSNWKTLRRDNGKAIGLTIDFVDNRLYWANLDKFVIESTDMLGLNHKVMQIDRPELRPIGVTQFKNYIYWINNAGRTIERANKGDGSNHTVIQKLHNNSTAVDLLVFHGSRQMGWNECASNSSGCQHLCLSLPNKTVGGEGTFRCECPTHYILNPDGKTCKAPERFLLFSQKNLVGRLHMDYNAHPEVTLPIRDLKNVKAIEFDHAHDSLIWVDGRKKNIMIADTNGLNRRVLVPHWNVSNTQTNNPWDLAVDPYSRRLFWTDSVTNVINVTRLDGTPVGVVAGIARQPRLITLIAEDGLMFWFNDNPDVQTIQRASLDGDSLHTILSDGINDLKALTADPVAKRLYWVGGNPPIIESSDLLGSSRETLVSFNSANAPVALAVSGDYLYWADRRRYHIKRVSLLRKRNEAQLVRGRLDFLTGLLAVGPPHNPNHPCSDNNSGCSHLCVIKDGRRQCSCPLHLSLIDEAQTTCGVPPTCTSLQFRCPSSDNCLPLVWKCDGSIDCTDPGDNDFDEHDCLYHPTDHFQCESGECITADRWCNRINNCFAWEGNGGGGVTHWDNDQMGCEKKVILAYCPVDQFRCESGECVTADQRCNGINDCFAGEGYTGDDDELGCAPCASDQFTCGSGECLDIKYRCNPTFNCLDRSDEEDCESVIPPALQRPEMAPVSNAAVGSLVSIGVISLFVIGVVLLVRRCPWNQGTSGGTYPCDQPSNSYTFQLNHLGGEHSTQKYLSRHERPRGHLKSTNLHVCPTGTGGSKSNSGGGKNSSSSAFYERNRPTGASSMSSADHVSSSNSSYPKETLNPPPSPVTERSRCTTEIYYAPAHKMNTAPNMSRSYRHYKMRNIPPPPTPCSTDVCEDSEPIPKQTHHKHTRRKRGYAKVPNIDPVNVDSEPYPPPPTPQYLSDSCPPSPSTGRSCFNPYPPPPSIATDSS